MTSATCICPPGRPPFDHLLESNSLCLAHRKDIQLVAGGWFREGGYWSKRDVDIMNNVCSKHALLTEEEAYDILLAEKE